jgi:uncharacterized SAM-dependent methyltransferase
VNHKFHYDSIKQTQKWLALHQVYAPSRQDADCARAYESSFAAALARLAPPAQGVHLFGLGCGGGRKDAGLLRRLRAAGHAVYYTPLDASLAMVLEARQRALEIVPSTHCFPLVCDLASADDLPCALDERIVPGAVRCFTFFGMLPNFEPRAIVPRLASLVRPGDTLLFSANLAPGADYAAGVRAVLPQYDNALTRDWLMTFLLDLGVGPEDGAIRFCVEDDPSGSGLKRISAGFQFAQPRSVQVETERFEFRPAESVRLFFSYRHSPALVRSLLGSQGLEVLGQWIASSEEEGVFLVGRGARSG